MRSTALLVFLVLAMGTALAQQQPKGVQVVKYGEWGMDRAPEPSRQPCGLNPPVGDCAVIVYEKRQIDEFVTNLNQKIADNQQSIQQNKVDLEKELAKDVNAIPSTVISALKAQIREEIKADVLKELREEIKDGKLKVSADAH